MLNKVMLIGNLGADPDLKYTNSGTAVCNFNVATTESYTDRNGQRVENTEWHKVSVFDKAAESVSKYLHKGSKVYVEGKIQTRKWQDQNGADRYSTEIRADRVQFLDRKEDGGHAPAQRPQPRQQYNQGGFPSEASGMDNTPF